MDQLFWKGNWVAVPEAEYLHKHADIIKLDEWIIEGYVDEKMSNRLNEAELVVYLDYSGVRCAYQLIKRWISHRKEARPELSSEALEKFSWRFFWLVLTRAERVEIEQTLKMTNPSNLCRLTTPKKFKKFLREKF